MGANIQDSPGAFETSVQKVITGVTQVIPAKTSLLVDGVTMTQQQIVAKLQAITAEYAEVRNLKAPYLAQVATVKGDKVADREFLVQLHGAIVGLLGRRNPQLEQFGYTPTKPRQTTSAQNTVAAAKRTITREMRNTMGSKEKQAVKATSTPDVSISNGKVSILTGPAAPATQAPQTTASATASGAQGAGGQAASGNSGSSGASASGASNNGTSGA